MKVLVVIGTRPEAIKMAPVIQTLLARGDVFETKVCVTAQHRALLDQVLETFAIQPDFDLNLMAPGQSVTSVTTGVLGGLAELLPEVRPEVVLVHGDTTTSFAAALAAFYQQIPVGHVEAGLRTYNRYSPFPEELNRRLCDTLCSYHYAPTEAGRRNLLNEQVDGANILVTGNTVIDALLYAAAQPYAFADPALEALGRDRKLVLVTAHRRESFGRPLENICRAVRDLVRDNPEIEVVYPVHPNPNVIRTATHTLAGHERIHLIQPLEYLPFVQLIKRAHLILTDSGGIQEEAPSLGKPVLVLREVTERPEAVEAGVSQLVGTAYDAIVRATQHLLDDTAAREAMAARKNPYGDGRAAQRIVDHLASLSFGTV